MIKKVKITEGFEFSDDNYGLVVNVGSDDSSEPDTEFLVIDYHEEGLWLTSMPPKEGSVFVYFPSFEFGTYIHEGFIEEVNCD